MDKEKKNAPEHVAIIMDGNRRWAQERNLPQFEGHRKGYEKMQGSPAWFFVQGVKVVSFFAFSTENWSRSSEEVNYLMKLMRTAFTEGREELHKVKHKVLVSGRIEELPGDLPEICTQVMDETKKYIGGIVNICLNYGGRAEIIDAVKKMIKNNVDLEQVHEGMLRKHFYQPDLSDPDIIVRMSGEQRLSGFLLWQSAYSELFFLKKYWPDFEKDDVDIIIDEYNRRERRFGK
jgi:undecaprenyl diphosphate synthase